MATLDMIVTGGGPGACQVLMELNRRAINDRYWTWRIERMSRKVVPLVAALGVER